MKEIIILCYATIMLILSIIAIIITIDYYQCSKKLKKGLNELNEKMQEVDFKFNLRKELRCLKETKKMKK